MSGSLSTCKAAIFGCAGLRLTEEEKRFFREHKPVGFILFARNCESPEQVKALVASLKEVAGHETPLILIDQEGGRVARLKPPHWRATPAAGKFALRAQEALRQGRPLKETQQAVYLNARLIAQELSALGINVNCAPLADVPAPYCHEIIGDRAYGIHPDVVGILAGEMARGLQEGGVLPVLKHLPGHGRAKVDSHEDLPVVGDSLEELSKTDFVPFRLLSDLPLGMTAHILYTAIDKNKVATVSPAAIDIIRNNLGFDGLLMSDDLSMKALKGDFAKLTADTINAGCDVVLHCNGKMEEMQAIAGACPTLSDDAQRRMRSALRQLQPPFALNYDVARATVDDFLSHGQAIAHG